jgi:hypothetical protein
MTSFGGYTSVSLSLSLICAGLQNYLLCFISLMCAEF